MLRDIDHDLVDAVKNGKEDDIVRCIENGANVNVKDPGRWNETPLHRAAHLSSDKLCRILLDAGAYIESSDKDGWTPLHFAADSGSDKCCTILLDSGAVVDSKSNTGWTPLHKAAHNGHDKCCNVFLNAGAKVDSLTEDDETPLHLAAHCGSVKCCKILLDAGASFDLSDKDGWTSLHRAADSDKCLRILLDAGAAVDSRDKHGWTPLHRAAFLGSDKCCKILLYAGATVDAKDKDGGTPLQKAAYTGEDKCCRILLDAGAEVGSSDKIGQTALHYASQSDSDKCSKILLEAGAVVDSLDKNDYTPLHLAADSGSEKCCRILLDAGAVVDSRTEFGSLTSLYLAARCGSEKCCGILLAAGAEVNAQDKHSWSPLHAAADSGSDKCCKILLDAGAIINLQTNFGETPLHKACKRFDNSVGGENEEYYKAITTLIRAGADISIKNKHGKTAFSKMSSSYKGRIVQQEYEKSSLHRKLMATGSHPVDVVKIFLCGNPAAGKTTLKHALTKKLSILSMVKGVFANTEKKDEEGDYTRTPGIEVGRESVRGVGEFIVWDCAGQIEYSVTHGMFLGSAQSIFVVIYNLLELLTGNMHNVPYILCVLFSVPTKFWLPFIKATRALDETPKVILVGTHSDKIRDQRIGLQAVKELLKLLKAKFSGILDIDEELILLDAREENSDGMEQLKTSLKRRRKEITGTEMLPKLCDKMRKIIKPWREEAVPVLDWAEYLKRVKMNYVGMDENTLRSVTAYLHIMGDVYWAEFEGKEDQVIINTQWFTTEVIGRAYAGEEFAEQFQTLLPNQALYSLSELREFFTDKLDTSQLLALLNHMDLVHETEEGLFLMPGKLPLQGKEVTWDVHEACDVKGVSIECEADTDIFNPSVFPCIQKKMLDARKGATVVSRMAVKCTLEFVDVFIQLSKHKEAINIAVMCRHEGSTKAAHACLEHTVEMIEAELFKKSAGTNRQRCHISQAALYQSKNLEDVWSYKEENLVEAERGDGLVRKDASTRPEDVTKIIFKGYDNVVLRRLGSRCRYDWLPVDAAKRCFSRLDVISEWREDYRSVARLLGIAEFEMERIVKLSENRDQSVTCNLIRQWCEKNGAKMTIGMLRKLLCRLSLEINVDALEAIDEVMESYPGKDTKPNHYDEEDNELDESVDFGVSDYLVIWRRVLKRNRAILLADMDPSLLTSRLLYLPLQVCVVFEGTEARDIQQRVNNAKTLLIFLLEREEEDWPRDLLNGLQETDQGPLAQTLKEEFEVIAREDYNQERQMTTLECEAQEIPMEVLVTPPTAGISPTVCGILPAAPSPPVSSQAELAPATAPLAAPAPLEAKATQTVLALAPAPTVSPAEAEPVTVEAPTTSTEAVPASVESSLL
ncbi:uncharacterized protein [Amphiura filiformis]|uniref:uncharacterized protein n=1 Tax=Amphiura filiformis TaxID=82378 RepID=UPI003B20C3BB